jgi:hypothetical protein
MIISSETKSILKNFATINPNMVFKGGNVIKTMSEARNILGSAVVIEDFPEFGIYDLNEFLSVLGMFGNPELTFSKDMKYVVIKEGSRSVKYFFSDIGILTHPTKDVVMPDTDVEFNITSEELTTIRKASSVLGLNDVVITKDGDSVGIKIEDVNDVTSNSFYIDLKENHNLKVSDTLKSFKFIFNVNNIKMCNSDFEVHITTKWIARFRDLQSEIEFFIAIDKNSEFKVKDDGDENESDDDIPF